jgi:hypothetical protein
MPSDRTPRLLAAAYWALAVVLAFSIGDRWRYDDGLRMSAWRNPSWSGPPAYEDLDTRLSNDLIGGVPFTLWPEFSIEWTGFLVVDEPGDYRFALDSDDGSSLDIDGTPLVVNGDIHRRARVEAARHLDAGVHAIRARYFQAGERSSLLVQWAPPGGAFYPLPPSQLLPDAMSYTEYRLRALRPVGATLLALAAFFGLYLGAWPRLRRLAASGAGAALERLLGALERPRVALAVIGVVGLVARVAMLASTPGVLWPDSQVFYVTAREILQGHWTSHDAYRTLVYPWLLAIFAAVSPTPAAGMVFLAMQMLMGLGAALLFYDAVRRVVGALPALAAGVLFAVHATELFYEASVLTESTFTLVLAFTVWLTVRAVASLSWRVAVALGLSTALLVLVRPVAQWYVLVPLGACLLARVPARRRMVAAGALLACYAVPLVWWMSVNQREFGFFGVALGRGMGLYGRVFDLDRLQPPDSSAQPELRHLWAFARSQQWSPNRVRDELNFERRYSGAQADDAMYRFALETARGEPWRFTVNTVRQWVQQIAEPISGLHSCPAGVGRFLCSGRAEGESLPLFPAEPATRSWLRPAVVRYIEEWQVPMAPVLAFGAVGLLAVELFQPEALILAVTIAYITLVPALSQVPQDRFRLPADPLIFAFAAVGVSALATRATALAALLRGETDTGPR